MKARDLIRRSLKLIGVLAAGENPSAEEQVDALESYNDMLDSWSTENLIIPSKVTEDFPLVVGQSKYGMGPSLVAGDFNTTRPIGIDGAAALSNNQEYPIWHVTLDQWQQIQQKATTSAIPTRLYTNEAFPLLELNFWPVPSAAMSVRIYSWKALSTALIDDDIILPPGYKQALIYSLGIVLAPEYGRQVDPVISAVATKSVANIKRKNIKTRVLGTDAAVYGGRRFNIYTGD